MFSSLHRLGWRRGIQVIFFSMTAALAHAKDSAPSAPQPDPLDPQVRVPGAVFTSAFASYRPLGDDTRSSWRQANETVNRIGGWRTYAREAQQPESPSRPAHATSSPSVNASPTPKPGEHRKH